jgi:predicted deacylase
MHRQNHPIATEDNVASFQLTSFHFGTPVDAERGRGGAKKVYLQASLHADEVPAMLVAHALKRELEKLNAAGRVKGEIILVPAANPIGLSQVIHGAPFGRFDLSSGVNFNRNYKHVADALKTSLAGELGPDADANAALVRVHARRAVAEWQPKSATQDLKKLLLSMAIDADIMLDLHCDNEAVLHLYTGTPLAERVQPLADLLGAHAVLLATESGGEPFDEACSRVWWELAEHFGAATPIPLGCVGVTIELRGENDVRYDPAIPGARRRAGARRPRSAAGAAMHADPAGGCRIAGGAAFGRAGVPQEAGRAGRRRRCRGRHRQPGQRPDHDAACGPRRRAVCQHGASAPAARNACV